MDNDPDQESSAGGVTDGNEPENSYIVAEPIADMSRQWGWSTTQERHEKRAAALHEVGHQFELPHIGGTSEQYHVMWAAGTDSEESVYAAIPLIFKDSDIDLIRGFGAGMKP